MITKILSSNLIFFINSIFVRINSKHHKRSAIYDDEFERAASESAGATGYGLGGSPN
jgi:hypothetical protein